MPWNNQGGGGRGPWGGGSGQNPWGRPSGGNGSGPTPPDFEAMLKRSQDRFKRLMPKGFGGARGILVLIGLVIVVWLATGIYRVQEDQAGVVLRFGEPVRVTTPGLHYHLPAPIESVELPSITRINRIDIGFVPAPDNRPGTPARDIPEESLMLTGDENLIDIDFTVLWRISDPQDYLFNIRNPEVTVQAVAESAMREVIGQTALQPALTEERGRIEFDTDALMQEVLDRYGAGIEIIDVQMQKVDPPTDVIDAFNDVQRALQDRERLQFEADRYRNRIIPEARGEARRITLNAEAYAEQIIAAATGDAERFVAVLQSYEIAPEVTARRLYLETLETVFQGVNKVIIDQGAEGAGQGVMPYLPLPELQRTLGTTSTPTATDSPGN